MRARDSDAFAWNCRWYQRENPLGAAKPSSDEISASDRMRSCTLIGVAGGTLLAFNIDIVVQAIERVQGMQFLDKSVYYISELPSDLQRADVITIAAIALALVATLYPAWRAARVNPAAGAAL